MLHQQQQMRRHQEEMLCQRNEMAQMANFGQQVLDAAGLAFSDASIPSNINLVGDDFLSQDYGSPRGGVMDDSDL
jgi:hypothetical protein